METTSVFLSCPQGELEPEEIASAGILLTSIKLSAGLGSLRHQYSFPPWFLLLFPLLPPPSVLFPVLFSPSLTTILQNFFSPLNRVCHSLPSSSSQSCGLSFSLSSTHWCSGRGRGEDNKGLRRKKSSSHNACLILPRKQR